MPRPRKDRTDIEIVTIPCNFKGCNHQATHHPKICIPARGWPIEAHKPMGAVIDFKLCKDHARVFDAQDLLNSVNGSGDSLMDVFAMLSQGGMQEPDFNRAFILAVPLNCDEALMMQPHGHA